MDPKWERAHQRLAEAYLALGPYEKALECCRALARAFKECAQPSEILVKLQGRAKSTVSTFTLGTKLTSLPRARARAVGHY
jgi:DNA-binding SARP family transcriptional activator